MFELFRKRKLQFIKQIQSYLPYVFNDHFVLVLIFLLGFLLFQYSELLKHFPDNPFLVIIGLVVTVLVLLHMGSVALYLEKADQQFLLVKEDVLKKIIKRAIFTSFIVWGSLQTLLLVFLFPLFLKIGFDIITFIPFLIILLVAKWFVLQSKASHFMTNGQLVWDKAIEYELNRKQGLLKFFSLFTTVKGISSTVKRRIYLDFLLKFFEKSSSKTWSNLYIRAFLRSSDYFGLSVRLLILSLLSILFIKNILIGLGLTVLFNYLLLFQLIALANHFNYQYLINLYPINNHLRKQNLISVLRLILGIVVIIEVIVGCFVHFTYLFLLVFPIIVELYLPYKLHKVID